MIEEYLNMQKYSWYKMKIRINKTQNLELKDKRQKTKNLSVQIQTRDTAQVPMHMINLSMSWWLSEISQRSPKFRF